MNSTSEALKAAFEKYSYNVLNTPNKLYSFLQDFAPQSKKENKLIKEILSVQGVSSRLVDAVELPKARQNEIIRECLLLIREATFLNEQSVKDGLNIIASALGMTIIKETSVPKSDDITGTVMITAEEATLGCTKTVFVSRTGKSFTIKIPPHVTDGEVLLYENPENNSATNSALHVKVYVQQKCYESGNRKPTTQKKELDVNIDSGVPSCDTTEKSTLSNDRYEKRESNKKKIELNDTKRENESFPILSDILSKISALVLPIFIITSFREDIRTEFELEDMLPGYLLMLFVSIPGYMAFFKKTNLFKKMAESRQESFNHVRLVWLYAIDILFVVVIIIGIVRHFVVK